MVYLLKIVIFYGYVSHNQMVSISSSYPAIVRLGVPLAIAICPSLCLLYRYD